MYLVFVLMWASTGVYFWLIQAQSLLEPSFHIYFSIPLILTIVALFVGRRWQAVVLGLLVVHEVIIPSNLFGLRG